MNLKFAQSSENLKPSGAIRRPGRHPLARVILDERIIAPGQWEGGRILLSRSLIRQIARETGNSVRLVLHETAYHEVAHGVVEPLAKLASRCLGADDIYDTSYEAMVYGTGRGYWYRAEEWIAERFGKFRARLRHKYGWR